MEFQETINYWKQQPHILNFFLEEETVKSKPKPSTFVEKFLQVSVDSFIIMGFTNNFFTELAISNFV